MRRRTLPQRIAPRWTILVAASSLALFTSCRRAPEGLVSRTHTFAELRTIMRGVAVVAPGEARREPYPRERLIDGEQVLIEPGGLAWLRRDGGATLLVAGPAALTLRADALAIERGKVFADVQASAAAELDTPRGALHLAGVRASLEVRDGAVSAYVLAGTVRTEGGAAAGPGELLELAADGKASKRSAIVWDDWTGGLATADPAAQPAPFGVGTVGARPPGDRGEARFALTIRRLDVRVKVDGDFATTEVDELFFNPTSNTVEGLYRFRTPSGAVLQRFGVDRGDELVWGRVKEKQAAAAQYQEHVYEGSREDPALLEWQAPGVYEARLYPIKAGETRRVVTRYAEWLGRQGARGERRLYVYPMAAEGAAASLPRIDELALDLDVSRAHASEVRVGMAGKQSGDHVLVKRTDFVPRADVAVELFDGGSSSLVGYRAPHALDRETIAEDELERAEKNAKGEPDYLLVPLRPGRGAEPPGGLDLAIVVDASAATDRGALAIARAMTGALLAHLGPSDRAAVWAGDATLRPVAEGSAELRPVDDARREQISAGLAAVERGGATDLGALVTEAAGRLEPGRRSALVYVGDGVPTVGEQRAPELRQRLERLSTPLRLFAIGVGDRADMGILSGLARGAFAERVTDAHGAAEAALRVLEQAERPVWLGASLDLGPGVERVFPRQLGALAADETQLVVGRLVGAPPARVAVRAPVGEVERALTVVPIDDGGDLRRRWAEGRLAQLLEEGSGRAAVVELGVRYGVATPFTSLYVPTAAEHAQERERRAENEAASETKPWWRWPWFRAKRESAAEVAVSAAEQADAKEGGSGTRAKGEEGSMGRPSPAAPSRRHGVRAEPSAADGDGKAARDEAQEFGMIGLLPADSGGQAEAPAAAAPGGAWGNAIGDSFGAGGLALSGIGEGGGGRAVQRGLGSIGSIGHGAGTGTGQGFGSGHGRLGGTHAAAPPKVTLGTPVIEDDRAPAPSSGSSRQPPETVAASSSLGGVGHQARACPPSAELPLDDRRTLWRERFGSAATAPAAKDVYDAALGRCEAPTWRERSLLLWMAIDRLGDVAERVALWRLFAGNRGAAELLYRAILTRAATPSEIRALHDALGLRRVDPTILAKALAGAKSAAARATLLRGLVDEWPDDLELALGLLDAHEDAKDDAAGRALARRLRQRGDATTRVRTAVGEYYLRLAASEAGDAASRDTIEARRTFGEIVEFAPDDPAARRRLGDLLRAHGWFDEAMRQYETLAQLTPDDPSVPLLLAAAAQGMGRTEEAVRWTEVTARASSPDATSPLARSARAWASAFLAWAREDAQREGRAGDVGRLKERARALAADDAARAGTGKVILTSAHPELRPALWSDALGTPMPAPDGDALLGVAQAVLPPSDAERFVELRLDEDEVERAARLRGEVALTAIFDEGTARERIAHVRVSYARERGRSDVRRRFRLEDGAMKEVP